MKDSLTQSMDWLHTWGGLLFGWLLFAIFLTGTLAVFDKDITHWMRPELHSLTDPSPDLDAAIGVLGRLAPNAERWFVYLPDDRNPVMEIGWRPKTIGSARLIDPITKELLDVRDTRGGDFFFRFHYQLLLERTGIWIVGGAAMVMLTALVTGLIIHRRIFKDFFTFRPTSPPHRAWLDVHNVTSILVLPFHLMITFTGLVIFWNIYMSAGLNVLYGGNLEAFRDETESRAVPVKAKEAASMVSVADLERQARPYWQRGKTRRIVVWHPGDRHATVDVYRNHDDQLAHLNDRVSFNRVTGQLLNVQTTYGPAYRTHAVLSGLHFVQFGGPTMRWLYFLMGLAASAMIATGLVLWVIKRRERHGGKTARIGFRLVEVLNVAAVAGLLVAIAAYLWANRLLPLDLENRALWEVRSFFAAWTLCAAHSFMRGGTCTAWTEQLTGGALLFGLLPLLNALTTESHLLATVPNGQWNLAGIDLTGLATGVLLSWTARGVGRTAPRGPTTRLASMDAPIANLSGGTSSFRFSRFFISAGRVLPI
jgi:uncharacterized iron-regulated membrane protein